MHYILWDIESQISIKEGTETELNEFLDSEILPGGSYQMYPYIAGYTLVKAEGRSEATNWKLRLTYEQD